jgi:ribosome-binding protein aMBF1 (putative translation factor)
MAVKKIFRQGGVDPRTNKPRADHYANVHVSDRDAATEKEKAAGAAAGLNQLQQQTASEVGWESGLGTAIQHRRVDLQISRKDLAVKAGISYPFLSEIEKGTKQPSSKKLGQLAEALEMTTEELVTRSKHQREVLRALDAERAEKGR